MGELEAWVKVMPVYLPLYPSDYLLKLVAPCEANQYAS